MCQRLKNKVALITGSGMGQGRAAALVFAREGARIIVGDIDETAAAETVELVKQEGGDAVFAKCDVGVEADCKNLVEVGAKAFGKIDVLYNNAGVLWKDRDRSVVDTEEANWDRVMAICLKGAFFITKYGIPELKKAGGGSIIMIGSISALCGFTVAQDAYTSAKGALISLTKSLAIQFAKDKVRCNIIHPGMVATPMQAKYMADPLWVKAVEEDIPLGRFGKPEDIAYAALYLASDESSFMTGSEMVVDGGFYAK